jgi:hypothetical protein
VFRVASTLPEALRFHLDLFGLLTKIMCVLMVLSLGLDRPLLGLRST